MLQMFVEYFDNMTGRQHLLEVTPYVREGSYDEHQWIGGDPADNYTFRSDSDFTIFNKYMYNDEYKFDDQDAHLLTVRHYVLAANKPSHTNHAGVVSEVKTALEYGLTDKVEYQLIDRSIERQQGESFGAIFVL